MGSIINSINARIGGMKKRKASCWREYISYYEDAEIWEDAILFESFGGKNFQGNPYYIYKEMFGSEKFRDMKLYIALQKPETTISFLRERNMYDERVHVVAYQSADYRNVLCHAKYLVNNMSFSMEFIKKPNQIYVNTWHGTPLKTLGRMVNHDPYAVNNPQRNMLMADILLAANDLTKRVFLEDHMVAGILKRDVYLGGYPRNTAFFDDSLRQIIRQKYQLNDRIGIFYMPTWRGNPSSGARQVDFVKDMEMLAGELGDGYQVYVKLHPAMSGQLGNLKKCKKMPEEYEVYEFLNAMDILVTDYSSVFFDFANTGRQVVLYQYDREKYYSERGVYSEVENVTPYPVVESYEELVGEIRKPSQIDDTEFKKTFCGYDCAQATEQLIDQMLSVVHTSSPKTDIYVIDFRTTDEQLLKWKQQLADKNFKFLLVPRRSNGYLRNITCYNQIEYLSLFPEKNVKWYEYFLSYEKAMQREKMRLWGDLNVGTVYSKRRRIPQLGEGNWKIWPNELAD